VWFAILKPYVTGKYSEKRKNHENQKNNKTEI